VGPLSYRVERVIGIAVVALIVLLFSPLTASFHTIIFVLFSEVYVVALIKKEWYCIVVVAFVHIISTIVGVVFA
jgi:hypothetical protein